MISDARFDTIIRPIADMGWMRDAACKGAPQHLFFPADDRALPTGAYICATCPVKQRCLEWAIVTGQANGTWGGMNPRQRRSYHKTHPELRIL